MAFAMPRLRHHRRGLYAFLFALILVLLWQLASYSLLPDIPWRKEWQHTNGFKGRVLLQESFIPHQWTAKTWRMSLPELQELIAGTDGYYVRDWSLGLGWNNLRYIIETSLLHAKLLNRVLVLPSFVYASEVCAQYGLYVDRTEAVGWDVWDGAPLSSLAWQLPIQVMLDLPHLREHYPVILTSEFYELHGLDPAFESLAGDWNRGNYEHENVTFPSIHVIPNGEYEPSNVVRVDTLRGLPAAGEKNPEIDQALRAALGDKLVLDWEDAVQALQARGWLRDPDADIVRVINSGDWIVMHTFSGAAGMDYTKTVVDPIKQVVPRSQVRGLVEDYYGIKAEVLLLEGEIHLGRKPGALRFTTESIRDDFTYLVFFAFRPVAPVRELAKTLAERMKERCGGRMWMAAHMRRGDFVAVNWSMEKSLEDHLARVQVRLATGRQVLEQMSAPETHIPSVAPPGTQGLQIPPPREGDPFFLATDERDAGGLAYLRNHSAVLIHDIMTIEDRRTFGWPLLFTDVLGLLEQSVVVQSSFFYGHALSSFAGGVLNMRTARGADPRTILID